MWNQLSAEEQNAVVRSMMAGLPASAENANRARMQLSNNNDLVQTMMRRAGMSMPGNAETMPETEGEFARAEGIRRQMGAGQRQAAPAQAPTPQARPSNAGAPRQAPVPSANPNRAAETGPDENANAVSRAADQPVMMENVPVPNARPEMANQQQANVDGNWNPALIAGAAAAAIATMYGMRQGNRAQIGSIDMRETGYRGDAGAPAQRMLDPQQQLEAPPSRQQLEGPQAQRLLPGPDNMRQLTAEERAALPAPPRQITGPSQAQDARDRVERRARGQRAPDISPVHQDALDMLMQQTDAPRAPVVEAPQRRRTSAAELDEARAARGAEVRGVQPEEVAPVHTTRGGVRVRR